MEHLVVEPEGRRLPPSIRSESYPAQVGGVFVSAIASAKVEYPDPLAGRTIPPQFFTGANRENRAPPQRLFRSLRVR